VGACRRAGVEPFVGRLTSLLRPRRTKRAKGCVSAWSIRDGPLSPHSNHSDRRDRALQSPLPHSSRQPIDLAHLATGLPELSDQVGEVILCDVVKTALLSRFCNDRQTASILHALHQTRSAHSRFRLAASPLSSNAPKTYSFCGCRLCRLTEGRSVPRERSVRPLVEERQAIAWRDTLWRSRN
jgi:hypothetical protein